MSKFRSCAYLYTGQSGLNSGFAGKWANLKPAIGGGKKAGTMWQDRRCELLEMARARSPFVVIHEPENEDAWVDSTAAGNYSIIRGVCTQCGDCVRATIASLKARRAGFRCRCSRKPSK
jgi:hypothetical protein